MIKFYLKVQNKMLTKNLLWIVTALVLIFNVLIRVLPGKFISIPELFNQTAIVRINPRGIYTYCDVYLLILFVILIFFFLGIDFKNSMEEIGLAIGGSKTNKFMARKLVSILLLYLILYSISFINIYSLYLRLVSGRGILIPLREIVFYSITTNIFIISLSLLILFVSRDIAVSTTIITAYYLIEEALWRCKITEKNGILGHIFQYDDYRTGEAFKIKLMYIILSGILLFITYKISKRKR